MYHSGRLLKMTTAIPQMCVLNPSTNHSVRTQNKWRVPDPNIAISRVLHPSEAMKVRT